MGFIFPNMLWLLLAVPGLVWAYFRLLRRRKKLAMRYPQLAVIRKSMGPAAWRRHIPPALLLAAVTLLILSLARPTAIVSLSSRGGTIIMALDVSASMSSNDVKPDRITAAALAAKSLIKNRAQLIRVGIVKFSGSAFLVQAPTTDNVALNAAIEHLNPETTTAIGDAVYASLQMLFPDTDIDAMIPGNNGAAEFTVAGEAKSGAPKTKKPAVTIVQPGSYKSAAIVLMTDGRNTTGPDPIEAARLAANMGVRIFTIGFGTPVRQMTNLDSADTNAIIDEPSLRQMASMTKAQYFHAQSAEELATIYQQLTTVLEKKAEPTEISVLLVAVAGALALLSTLLSLLWYHKIF